MLPLGIGFFTFLAFYEIFDGIPGTYLWQQFSFWGIIASLVFTLNGYLLVAVNKWYSTFKFKRAEVLISFLFGAITWLLVILCIFHIENFSRHIIFLLGYLFSFLVWDFLVLILPKDHSANLQILWKRFKRTVIHWLLRVDIPSFVGLLFLYFLIQNSQDNIFVQIGSNNAKIIEIMMGGVIGFHMCIIATHLFSDTFWEP